MAKASPKLQESKGFKCVSNALALPDVQPGKTKMIRQLAKCNGYIFSQSTNQLIDICCIP